MTRYDYSLDVGKSIETDEKIKEMEKKQPQGCCNAPTPPDKTAGDEKPETNEEKPVEEEQLENVPEEPKKQEEDKEEKVEIKPISFEKAKLISDFEQKPKEKLEQEVPNSQNEVSREPKIDAKLEKEEPFEREPEEDEKDVNEFLEESFNRESKEYEEIQNKKNNNKEIIKEESSRKRRLIITAIVILIAVIASVFGYIYFKEPAEPTVAVVTPEMINLTAIMQENVTNETIIEPVEEKNVSVDDALDLLTSSLKD